MAGGVVDELRNNVSYSPDHILSAQTNLNSVTSGASGWLEVGGWSPDVATVVLGLLDNGVLRNSVLGWALKENESDSSLGGWVPGDLVQVSKWFIDGLHMSFAYRETFTCWHNAVQTRLADWVALYPVSACLFSVRDISNTHNWSIASRRGVGGYERRKGSEACGEDLGEHLD